MLSEVRILFLFMHIQFFVCFFHRPVVYLKRFLRKGGVEAEQTCKGEIPVLPEMQFKGLEGKFPLEVALINLPVPLRITSPWEAILWPKFCFLDRLVYWSPTELPGVPADSPGHMEVFPQPVHKHESLQETGKGGIREEQWERGWFQGSEALVL